MRTDERDAASVYLAVVVDLKLRAAGASEKRDSSSHFHAVKRTDQTRAETRDLNAIKPPTTPFSISSSVSFA